MIDLSTEEIVPLADAPAKYPYGRPHRATVYRHSLNGVRGVRLETILIGGRRFTSTEAVHRFVRQLNDRGQSSAKVTSEVRRRQLECIDAELDAKGF